MKKTLNALRHLAGISNNRTSHQEKLISGCGGFTGILLTLVISQHYVGHQDAALVVASIGASAVLLFAIPHGPLSQPWAVLGGHLVSGFIGVSCFLLIPNVTIAAALAVGLAVTAMYYLRCIHPPGGATALTAVMAGPSVHDMGYQFLVTPVFINVVVILTVAVGFNFLFPWRRYPAASMHYGPKQAAQPQPRQEVFSREDLDRALSQMNAFVDIHQDDLQQIFALAHNRPDPPLDLAKIRLGHYYSNGEYGEHWSVRQVVDEPDPSSELIIYKIVAGKGRRSSGTTRREEFAKWAKYEVFLNENSWQRVTQPKESVTQ